MNRDWWRGLRWLPSKLWQELHRLPSLLAAPRTDPVKQTQRIIGIQRNIVFPAKAVIISSVFYYLYFSRGMDDMARIYGKWYEMMRSGFAPYLIVNIFATVAYFVVRGFSLGFAQGMVFVVGLVDGLFLAGLTLLTQGFNSEFYWIFAGLIVVNAICIPLATPQIALNLLLTVFYLGAGMVERNVRASLDSSSIATVSQLPRTSANTPYTVAGLQDRDIRVLVQFFRRPAFGRRLPAVTRQQLLALTENQMPDSGLKEALVAELNRIFPPAREVGEASDPADPPVPAKAVRLQLAVLWLLTLCCYGVQLLAARQRQALEDQQEFLSRSGQLRAAGRLAAEIAHKVKNPLGIINNAAFSLQKSLREGRNVSPQEVQIIQEEVERSDRIITQIMGYATLSEGRVEKLDVAEELERAIQNVFPLGAGFAIEVNRQIASDLPPLWMQPAHFNEILVNILQNAREALNGVGLITVSARTTLERAVEVVVEDNGPGIPSDKLERIFEPYFSMRDKGTGLGLAIARHNAELYAGTVKAESTLGKGARFRVFFPARSSLDAAT
jgi:signal transduction histidine kinase